MDNLITATELSVTFGAKRSILSSRQPTPAVKSISLTVAQGETLGIVGESGCGKSTFGRALLGLIPPTSGTIAFKGKELAANGRVDRTSRRNMQIVHQDPYASFDPLHTVGFSLLEPLLIHKGPGRKDLKSVVNEEIASVGLNADVASRFPHEFSGGQLQRLSIARALILRPELVLLDEAVSALDVSIRAQVLSLLDALKSEYSLTYLFISHDLGVVEQISTRVAVMYLGRIVELATTRQLFLDPRHPYSKALLSAVPVPDPRRERSRERIILAGDVPNARAKIDGCEFRPRCPLFQSLGRPELCVSSRPELSLHREEHSVACHFAGES